MCVCVYVCVYMCVCSVVCECVCVCNQELPTTDLIRNTRLGNTSLQWTSTLAYLSGTLATKRKVLQH